MSVHRISRQPTPALPQLCHIFKFPDELLAETIAWLQYPEDILPLAYTCRKLRNFLLDPSSAYVWRKARERFVIIEEHTIGKPDSPNILAVMETWSSEALGSELKTVILPGEHAKMFLKIVGCPIPTPVKGMCEYMFIRMLFGPKTCRICGKDYTGRLRSFSLRFPVCSVSTVLGPIFQ